MCAQVYELKFRPSQTVFTELKYCFRESQQNFITILRKEKHLSLFDGSYTVYKTYNCFQCTNTTNNSSSTESVVLILQNVFLHRTATLLFYTRKASVKTVGSEPRNILDATLKIKEICSNKQKLLQLMAVIRTY